MMNISLGDKDVALLYIDLFSGAGGVSTGIEQATINGRKAAKVIAAINHDPVAIASHAANHPETHHFIEDIRTLDMSKLIPIVADARAKYPNALIVLWASLECTNFSRAKGGLPREGDSRTLAYHLYRYIQAINPDLIQIENVEEFMSWGPLDENGRPVSRFEGRDYIKWVEQIKAFGYSFDKRLLNSADYGAHTSRIRFFGQFAKHGLPIVWPDPTHSRKPQGGLFGHLEPWRPVKEVLDFSDEGKSIFNREKPLSDNTLERIYAGLIKYVAGGKKEFLSKYYSGDPKSKNISIDSPAHSITAKDHHALVQCFISQYYGNGGVCSVDSPATTLTTKDRLSLVWIDKQFSGKHNHQTAESPLGSITTVPKANLMNAFIMNPAWGGNSGSIENPCCVIVARQDKAPLYLIGIEQGLFSVPVYDDDSEVMIRIKQFMYAYGIVDIKMRMLRVQELKLITGFPANYILHGNQSDQKKFIGNAVPCAVPKAMVEALTKSIALNIAI